MKATKNYYTNRNYESRNIPTREEFHRYASNKLADGDFCTEYPSGYQVSRVTQALDWTMKKTAPKIKYIRKGNR